MDIELLPILLGRKKNIRAQFLAAAGLEPDADVDCTILVWDGDDLIATGSRKENILKCIAVDPARQGEGLTATVLTQLRQDAFNAGCDHLFLYTKPQNLLQFSSLFFYPIAQTDQVLLMEDRPNGIGSFLDSLPAPASGGKTGALVMNCNPFTLGHRYVIETAAKECDRVYVFVLSEDKSQFSADVRMELVKQGTGDLPNVTVLPTGPYLISSATFPTYFLKERDHAQAVQCQLDIAVFTRYFVPKFGITHRYVGTEPLSAMTDQYNQALMEHLPKTGIEVRLVPRLEHQGKPISATSVRQCINLKDYDKLKDLVPPTTLEYIRKNF
ncbi:MAG: [Oscillospiraceae bacterium]|nr:[citrate (pro-3S)-lyase] ligase [Oscillospiraceae bacterium]